MKPLGKVKIQWSPNFAYAIGLIATDGCIYGGRNINLTSNDEEQIKNFLRCLNINAKISKKGSGMQKEKKYFYTQFGDIIFCKFLNSIGITAHKSKTIGEIGIPSEYFFDFLRGHLDGDGTFHSYWDRRWASSFMFYTEFASASENHINWLRKTITDRVSIHGHIGKSIADPVFKLKYAKKESLQLLVKIYYDSDVVCLSRKRLKIEKALATEGRFLTK